MNVMLTSATVGEIAPVLEHFEEYWKREAKGVYRREQTVVQIVLTGVGCPSTAFALGYFFGQAKPDLALNVGVAGALQTELQIGAVTRVMTEVFADLGTETADGGFLDLFQMDLLLTDSPPFREGVLRAPDIAIGSEILPVSGITVNKVHGHGPSIEEIQARYPDAGIETMEGAAFFYACLLAEVPFLQLRAISNAVEPRDKSRWNLPLAIRNLNKTLIDLIPLLT